MFFNFPVLPPFPPFFALSSKGASAMERSKDSVSYAFLQMFVSGKFMW